MNESVALYVALTLLGLSGLGLVGFLLVRTGEMGVETGKKALIWFVFLALLYSLRDVFAILFLTFLISFVANTAIVRAGGRLKIHRRWIVVLTYLLFVGLMAGAIAFVLPNVRAEGMAFVEFAAGLDAPRVDAELDRALAGRPGLASLAESLQVREELHEALRSLRGGFVATAGQSLRTAFRAVNYFLVSLIFSFLIMLDLAAMKAWIVTMKDTRLGAIYDEIAGTVVQFGGVLGQVFQAQMVIAVANTALTTVGLLVLGVPSVAFLALVVFLCSFVPVLGVFASSVPIGLLALRDGGVGSFLAVVGWIGVIHAIEAYVLNPRIMAHKMELNPVLVLVILFISHHYFGLWGVLLGVPVAFYVFKYALPGRPFVLISPEPQRPGATTTPTVPDS
ncbi:MAG: AI-2E family transporter [Longimicrobiales bacterium]|nr:AI-2E family transporter [Longimicrobiales bacterium]